VVLHAETCQAATAFVPVGHHIRPYLLHVSAEPPPSRCGGIAQVDPFFRPDTAAAKQKPRRSGVFFALRQTEAEASVGCE
jgi:hypothetical protein